LASTKRKKKSQLGPRKRKRLSEVRRNSTHWQKKIVPPFGPLSEDVELWGEEPLEGNVPQVVHKENPKKEKKGYPFGGG